MIRRFLHLVSPVSLTTCLLIFPSRSQQIWILSFALPNWYLGLGKRSKNDDTTSSLARRDISCYQDAIKVTHDLFLLLPLEQTFSLSTNSPISLHMELTAHGINYICNLPVHGIDFLHKYSRRGLIHVRQGSSLTLECAFYVSESSELLNLPVKWLWQDRPIGNNSKGILSNQIFSIEEFEAPLPSASSSSLQGSNSTSLGRKVRLCL